LKKFKITNVLRTDYIIGNYFTFDTVLLEKKDLKNLGINPEDLDVIVTAFNKNKSLENWKKLSNNSNKLIRLAAAKEGYFRSKFKKENDPEILFEAGKKGYDLSRFVNDKNPQLRALVPLYTKNINHLRELLFDKNPNVRASIASRGVYHTCLQHDESVLVRRVIARRVINPNIITALIKDPSYIVRATIAKRVPPSELISLSEDFEPLVRSRVAVHPQFHKKLLNDRSRRVRATIAEHTNDQELFTRLLGDSNWEVRVATLFNKKMITKKDIRQLSEDLVPMVRAEVVKMGYNFNSFNYDSSILVKNAIKSIKILKKLK